MDFIQSTLLLYWISDVVLLIYGIPHTFDWIQFPKMTTEIFSYGKTRRGEIDNPIVKLIEIPKSWFTHFYIYGFFVSLFMVVTTFGCFIFAYDTPGRQQLAALMGEPRDPQLDHCAVLLICLAMLIQHSRRVYECFYVSVYSKGTMNVVHYLLGGLLYTTVQVCAICHGPKLELPADHELLSPLSIKPAEILTVHWNKIVGSLIFLWASYHHNRSHVILGNLRKTRDGSQILHKQHVIPRGGLFELLSAPHFLCEIIIYLAMGIISWNCWTFWMGPVLLTVINQLLMINETHKWYKNNFKDYPVRYRFVPYVL